MRYLIHLFGIIPICATQCMVDSDAEAQVHAHVPYAREKDAYDFITSPMEFANDRSISVLFKRDDHVRAVTEFPARFGSRVEGNSWNLVEAIKNSWQYGDSVLKFCIYKQRKPKYVMSVHMMVFRLFPDGFVQDLLKQAHIILRLESESVEDVPPILDEIPEDRESDWRLDDNFMLYRPFVKGCVFSSPPANTTGKRVIRQLYQWAVANHYRLGSG